MTAVAVQPRENIDRPTVVSSPGSLSLREAVSQVCDGSRNLLGLIALSNAAQRDLNSGSPEATLDGVISKAVLRSLLSALHYRDNATLRHSRRVALLAVGLAHHLGWEGRHLRLLEVAALLHDVGKIGVPDNVLYKPGKLRVEEVELIDLYHGVGVNVLQACRVDSEVLLIVDQAHRAYAHKPAEGVSIREVHIGARILAVADAYESLCTEQVYRVAKPHDEIMKILMAESGKQFDGNVVSALARWVQHDGLPFAAQTAELHDRGRNRTPFSLEEAAEAMALCQIFSYLYVLENVYDGFHIVDADRRFVVWNRGVEQLSGRRASEMLGKEWSETLFSKTEIASLKDPAVHNVSTLDDAIDRGKAAIFQLPYQDLNGSEVSLELQTVPLVDAQGHLHGVAEIFRNLSRHSTAPELKQLKLQASRDALTNVANRGELERRIRDLTEQFQENPNEPYSVIFADADHFKRVNDTYGHQVGDQVLIDLARHFCDETYSGEIVGRYGGEEFVILCPGTKLEHAVRRAERLRNSLKNSKVGGVDRLAVRCSFGVAQIETGETSEEVLGKADRALYSAKEAGRDRTCWFTSADFNAQGHSERSTESAGSSFKYSGCFWAFLTSEIVIHKLGAFIKDQRAQLVDVTRERVSMRLRGVGGLFGFFETPLARQGIEIEMLIEGTDRGDQSQRLRIIVKMSPFGRYRNANAFHERTHLVMDELKKYFLAE